LHKPRRIVYAKYAAIFTSLKYFTWVFFSESYFYI